MEGQEQPAVNTPQAPRFPPLRYGASIWDPGNQSVVWTLTEGELTISPMRVVVSPSRVRTTPPSLRQKWRGYQGMLSLDFGGTRRLNVVPPVTCRYVRIAKTSPGLNTAAELRVYYVNGSVKEVGVTRSVRSVVRDIEVIGTARQCKRFVLSRGALLPLSHQLFDIAGHPIK